MDNDKRLPKGDAILETANDWDTVREILQRKVDANRQAKIFVRREDDAISSTPENTEFLSGTSNPGDKGKGAGLSEEGARVSVPPVDEPKRREQPGHKPPDPPSNPNPVKRPGGEGSGAPGIYRPMGSEMGSAVSVRDTQSSVREESLHRVEGDIRGSETEIPGDAVEGVDGISMARDGSLDNNSGLHSGTETGIRSGSSTDWFVRDIPVAKEAVDVSSASALEFTTSDHIVSPGNQETFTCTPDTPAPDTLDPYTPESLGGSVIDRPRHVIGVGDLSDKGDRGMIPLDPDMELHRLGDLAMEDDSVTLLRRLRDGVVTGRDLEVNQRLGVVMSLTDQGYTEDEQAAMLGISRRTVVRDKAKLREIQARQAEHLDEGTLAGMVVHNSQSWIMKSVKDGMLRQASKIQCDMIELLQSLGLVYRAPIRQDVRSLNINKTIMASKGYQTMVNSMGNEKERAAMVLDDILAEMAGQMGQS